MRHVIKINWRKISQMMDDKVNVKVIFVSYAVSNQKPLSWSLKGMKNNEREFFHHCSSFTSNFLPLSGQNSLTLKYFQKIIKEDEKKLDLKSFFFVKKTFHIWFFLWETFKNNLEHKPSKMAELVNALLFNLVC